MADGGFAKDRSALAGLGEAILDTLSERTTGAEWGAWLQAPYERAAAACNVFHSISLLQAGARGSHLHPAVRGGHDDLVTDLLRLGASPTAKDNHGDVPIHIAAFLGRVKKVQALLEIEEVDEFEVDAKGRTAAQLACWNGDVPTVEALLDGTFADWCSGDAAWTLAECGGDHLDERGNAAPGCEQDNVPMIDFLVGEAGTDVDVKDDHGRTPLHSAALKGASQAITALVEHGPDLTAAGEEGHMSLHHTATGSYPAAIDVLCTAGVDINLRVNQSLDDPEDDTWSALDFAAIEDNVDAFKALVRRGVDWRAVSEADLTVLHTAAASNKTGVIDALIELGAPVDGPGEADATPLYTATTSNSLDAARAFVWHEASVQTPNASPWLTKIPRFTPLYRGDTLAQAEPSSRGLTDVTRLALRTTESGGSTNGEGAGDFRGLSERVLELDEEGIFLTIIGFL
eukprot:g12699.t1